MDDEHFLDEPAILYEQTTTAPTPHTELRNDKDYKIYVGSLSFDATKEDIEPILSTVGSIKNIEIISYNGRSKGCALVEYNDKESVPKAIAEYNNTLILGRPIFVREDRVLEDRPFNKYKDLQDRKRPAFKDRDSPRDRKDGCSIVIKNVFLFNLACK